MASATNPHKIFLVDDDPVVRRGIRELIMQSSAFEVVGEVGSIQKALDAILSASPDLVIIDLSMGGGVTGYDLTMQLKDSMPEVSVLVVSVYKGGFYVKRAREAGADGYVSKDQAEDQLLDAITALREGRDYFRPEDPDRPIESEE